MKEIGWTREEFFRWLWRSGMQAILVFELYLIVGGQEKISFLRT